MGIKIHGDKQSLNCKNGALSKPEYFPKSEVGEEK
jgi:hypothetical protein